MTEAKKPDLFGFLAKLSVSDFKYVDALPEADKKTFAPVVIMRWLSGTTDKKQIRYLNHFVNPMVFNMYQHPDMAFRLMMASCTGAARKYSWIKRNKKTEKSTLSVEVIKAYYQCSAREAQQYLSVLSKDDLMEMAEALGYEKELLKKLKKE
jgi:hypothetical protein